MFQDPACVEGGTSLSPPQESLLRVPGWSERYPWLRAGFSTRQGGRTVVYGTPGEQNLGWTAEDDPEIIASNRRAFACRVTGGVPLPLTTLRQVHSAQVRNLEQEAGPWRSAEGKALLEGDGLLSLAPGRLLAILTADCVPVLIADTRTHAVGACHAGWRGTLGRVVQAGIARMQAEFGSQPEDLVAAIGPCINACCFEVGEEVRSAFLKAFSGAHHLFSEGKGSAAPHLDLVQANYDQLLAMGISAESISPVAPCTACSTTSTGARHFFSYRAEKGGTGRMLSAIAALR